MNCVDHHRPVQLSLIAICALVLLLLRPAPTQAQVVLPSPEVINTVAGNGTACTNYSTSQCGDTKSALNAQLSNPHGVAIDGAGNIYIADDADSLIRKVNALTGNISTVAGTGTGGFSGDGGLATNAQLNNPTDVAVDSAGNLYVADYSNARIRKVTAAGYISTVAGDGTQHYSGDNGPASSAELNGPTGVAVDSSGNVYIADTGSTRIRAINMGSQTITIATIQIPAGYIKTIAGAATKCASGDSFGNGCPATQALLSAPAGVALDGNGNIYVADTSHHEIREVSASSGYISAVAGTGTGGWDGDGGSATLANLHGPRRVTVDSSGNIYIADTDSNCIRWVSPLSGVISTLAGHGTVPIGCPPGFSGDGGQASNSELNTPIGIAVDKKGNIYIADNNNNRVRAIGAGNTAVSSGGTLTGSNSGMTLNSATIVQYNTITGTNLGTVSFSTGSLASGSLQTGGTFNAGGSVVITTNGSNGTPNGVDFSGQFSGTVSWSLATLVDGTHQYTLLGSVNDNSGNSGVVKLMINTGLGWFNGSTTATRETISF